MAEFLIALAFIVALPLMVGYIITAIFTAEHVTRYKNIFLFTSLLSLPMLLITLVVANKNNDKGMALLLNTAVTFISLICSVTMARHVSRPIWLLAITNSLLFLLAILMVAMNADPVDSMMRPF